MKYDRFLFGEVYGIRAFLLAGGAVFEFGSIKNVLSLHFQRCYDADRRTTSYVYFINSKCMDRIMTAGTVKLEEIESKNIKEILDSVLDKNQLLTIQLPSGEEVIIQPKPSLQPLPELEGFVPNGWKDAIYR